MYPNLENIITELSSEYIQEERVIFKSGSSYLATCYFGGTQATAEHIMTLLLPGGAMEIRSWILSRGSTHIHNTAVTHCVGANEANTRMLILIHIL